MVLESPVEFFTRKEDDLDAMVLTAEAGSAWTLIYPAYSVAVPHPDIQAVPVAYPVARGDSPLIEFVNTWIELKKNDQTIEGLYNYWILGQNPKAREPRWSVIRNVLHWVE